MRTFVCVLYTKWNEDTAIIHTIACDDLDGGNEIHCEGFW